MLQSLRSSTGALTAPILLAATLDYVEAGAVTGDEAGDVFDDYHRRDVVAEWGAAGLARAAAAVLAHHCEKSPHLPATDPADAEAFAGLRAVGSSLRG